ncbi:MAG: hypothetical protein EB127_15900 [Alphaproteobacteria bacterium]|jgi:hypothetical protein|nr:hypothetical protein [Alphaproteobacteria bacterium]
MSFSNLKLAELKTVAESFGVDVPAKVSKNDLVLLLEEEGISYQMYDKFANVEKEEIKAEVGQPARLDLTKESSILVKMDRENFSYQIGTPQGAITFTKEHPFVALPESVADEIFVNHAGFRPATPREVQEFYS